MSAEDIDLARDTSGFLVEIRTVLKRAETARKFIGDSPIFWLAHPQPVYGHPYTETRENRDGTTSTIERKPFIGYSTGSGIPHPGAAEAIAALDDLITRLEPYRRTKRKGAISG